MSSVVDDPVLRQFRADLLALFGSRLDRAILFGSRARDDGSPDSDYDVAVFLRDMPDRWEDMKRLADLGTDILDRTGAFVHAMPYRAETYADAGLPLMHEIRRDGIAF